MRCIDCARLKLRNSPEMAVLGFGQCERKSLWEFQSITHDRNCEMFRADAADKVQARVDWFKNLENRK